MTMLESIVRDDIKQQWRLVSMNLSDNKIIMYHTDDGVTEIDVHMED